MSSVPWPDVPIPNTPVKPTSAHGSTPATAWESKSSPAQYLNPAFHESGVRGGAVSEKPALQ